MSTQTEMAHPTVQRGPGREFLWLSLFIIAGPAIYCSCSLLSSIADHPPDELVAWYTRQTSLDQAQTEVESFENGVTPLSSSDDLLFEEVTEPYVDIRVPRCVQAKIVRIYSTKRTPEEANWNPLPKYR
jgi:hypothetical protein